MLKLDSIDRNFLLKITYSRMFTDRGQTQKWLEFKNFLKTS